MADLVLALGFDLFFKPRLSQAAQQLGVELRHAQPKDALAASEGATRVVADVSAPGVLDAVLVLRKSRPELPVLACYPHVQRDLAEAVERAGGRAVTRGAFNGDLLGALRSV